MFHFRNTLYWMWYVRQEVPIFGHLDHQFAQGSREPGNTQIWSKQFQIAQVAHSKVRRGSWISWNQWNWKIYSLESTLWKHETQSWQVR